MVPAELRRLLGETAGALELARLVVAAVRLAEAEMLVSWGAGAVVNEEVKDPIADPLTVALFVEFMDRGDIDEGGAAEPFVAMEPFVNGSSAVPHTAAGA